MTTNQTTNPTPRTIPEQPADPWVVWRIYGSQRSQAGSYPDHATAERARLQLSRAMPRFKFVAEFVGKSEYHADL